MYVAICILSVIAFLILISGCSKESKIERHWKKGETYFSENKLKEAVIEYKNIIQLEPKHSKAYYKLGMAYLKMGMIREGYVALTKAVEINPDMVEARNQLGGLYLLSRDTKKAREQAELILAKDAKNSLAHMLLSNIYLMEKNLDGAIEESKKAVEGENKLEAYLHLANLYIIKKDLSSAEEMLKAAVKVDEKSLRGRFALAEFYFRSGNKKLAEREYIEATKLAPNDPTSFMQLGNFFIPSSTNEMKRKNNF